MKYMMLVCVDEAVEVSEGDGDATAWVEEMDGRGVRLAGNRLRSIADAVTIRVRDGDVSITDGPFAET